MKVIKLARYDMYSQAIHWMTAVIVLIAFIVGPGGSEQHVYARQADGGRQLHETLGMCVFMLTILRLLWRIKARRPRQAPVAPWMGMASTVVQYGLYLLLLALPVTALAGIWLEGHALTLLWKLQISAPISTHHDAGSILAETHGWLGDAILWLAGVHAAAALCHHFVLKDEVLISMLPRWLIGSR